MNNPSVLMLAGEASGDHHAASLVAAVKVQRPDIRFYGIGGDMLADAGMELLHHYRDVNTIGLSEGFGKLRLILASYNTMKRELLSGRHDLFIPVDFPDVNIRLCSFAKRAGTPVYYYISPQVWAWRKGRIEKIATRVDRMMTIFPFEAQIYRNAGLQADFVGHGMASEVPAAADKRSIRDELGVTAPFACALVPGSRQAEVARMAPLMLEAARIHTGRFPDTQFLLPLAGEHLAGLVQTALQSARVEVIVTRGGAASVMAACDYGLVTSGTATLQAALCGMPHAVAYILDGFTWFLAMHILKPLVMDKDIHVAMSNVLAIQSERETGSPLALLAAEGIRIPCGECGRPLLTPELLQDSANAGAMAEWLERFRTDANLIRVTKQGFDWIRNSLIQTQTKTAAEITLEFFEKREH